MRGLMYIIYGPQKIHRFKKIILYLNNPDWLDRNKDDNYIKEEIYLRNKNRFIIDGEGFYLAPTNPAVNRYLISVVDELSKKYNLDGIHYDYIRFHNSRYGFNEMGLLDFNKKILINLM